MSPPVDPNEAARRRRSRAILMAVLLALFVVLVYAITIAKMTVNR
jgi:predicted nucleic acid-binding Zn ribbon protein